MHLPASADTDQYQLLFPRVKLIFQPAHSDSQTRKKLLNGTLDIALILDVPRPGNSIHLEPLIQEQMVLVCSSTHKLRSMSEVLPHHLEHETLLLTESGCSYRTYIKL